jgi:hypothetical protein
MSYKARLSTAIVSSVFLFAVAVLIWGYQTGKIVILGNQQTTTATKTFETQEELLEGQANDVIDLSDADGVIKLKPITGGSYPTDKTGVYTSPAIGQADLISFKTFTPIDENKPGASLSQSFSDVPTNNWAFQQIEAIYRAGVTTGCPTAEGEPKKFCPTEALSREQLAAAVVRAFYFPESVPLSQQPGSYYFPDVSADSVFNNEIGLAKELNIFSGYPDGTFRPKENVTRDQMAVALVKTLKLDTSNPGAAVFPDVPADYWAFKEIQACYKAGIIQGYPDGTYRPSDVVDRAQMAVFIAKAYPVINDLTTKFIVYQFSGSSDGAIWSSWQSLPTLSPSYDLSKLPSDSKYLKVRIYLAAINSSSAPSLGGFAVSYEVPGVVVTEGPSTTKLVSTGTVLWFNLLLALILSGGISYLLLRKNWVKK